MRAQAVPTALYVEFPFPFGKSYDAGKRRYYSQHLVSNVEDNPYASYFHIQWRPLVDVVARFSRVRYTEEPVQIKFGWHVILLDDTRESQQLREIAKIEITTQ